jgi:hypothetical protein
VVACERVTARVFLAQMRPVTKNACFPDTAHVVAAIQQLVVEHSIRTRPASQPAAPTSVCTCTGSL